VYLPKAICPRHKSLQKSEEDLPVFRRVLFLVFALKQGLSGQAIPGFIIRELK
jgi:hypothetical protein